MTTPMTRRQHPVPDWPDAACRGSEQDFVPDSELPEVVNPLKAVCAGCPRSIECAGYAIPDATAYGVWGGLTTGERASIRRAMNVGRVAMIP